MNPRSELTAALAAVLLLAACQPSSPPPPPAAEAAAAATAPAAPASEPAAATGEIRLGDLVISEATSRETPLAGGTGPGFLRIRNAGSADDRLLAATSPAVEAVEIHEMSMAEGQMQMRALPEGLAIPAGATVELAPGGLHLMLIGVREPLAAGQTVPLELRFEKAGTVTVPLAVLARGG